MTTVLFLIYTAVFATSFFVGGDDMHIVIGCMTGAAVFYCFFRSFYLTARCGLYRKKYLGFLLSLLVFVPYLFLPLRVVTVISYSYIAMWHYIIPFLRLATLRLFYTNAIKKACRERNHKIDRTRDGMIIRTPGKTYDVRMVGSFRHLGLVNLIDGTQYTMQWVPTYVAENTDFLQYALEGREGIGKITHTLLVGRTRTHTLAWSDALTDNPNADRVLLFLPGLCEWKFNGAGRQTYTNGSLTHGIRLYEADAFAEKLQ